MNGMNIDALWKERIAIVASAGPASGRIIWMNIWKRFAPSIIADSSTSFGMLSKNCFIRKIPKASVAIGTIIP